MNRARRRRADRLVGGRFCGCGCGCGWGVAEAGDWVSRMWRCGGTWERN